MAIAPVRTLMVYRSGGAASLFAATGGTIKDVTAGGDIASASVTGLTNNDWIWVNFSTSGGNFLVAVNGVDSVRNFDGSTWTMPSISGVTSSQLSYVTSYNSMLVFLRVDSQVAYFLPVDSIAGTVTALNIGPELRKGGYLVACAAITQDAGDGQGDYLAFLSSQGEVVVYIGTDPRAAETWNMVGSYQIGRPIGRRCLHKLGGDVAALTQDGVVSLVAAIHIDRSQEQNAAFTANIRKAFADQYLLTGSVFGWQLSIWPAAHMAVVNVPIVDGVTYHQYVMNTITGAWCRFTGIDAVCWAIDGDNIYIGGTDSRVLRFGTVSQDDGDAINATCVGAFSPMDEPGQIKHTKMAQVFARGTSTFNLGINIAVDFSPEDLSIEERSFASGAGVNQWDQALWDSATWGGGGNLAEEAWLGVSVSGHYLAPAVLGTVNNATVVDSEFISMNILYELGSVLG